MSLFFGLVLFFRFSPFVLRNFRNYFRSDLLVCWQNFDFVLDLAFCVVVLPQKDIMLLPCYVRSYNPAVFSYALDLFQLKNGCLGVDCRLR